MTKTNPQNPNPSSARSEAETLQFTIEMDQVEDYAFRVRFDNSDFPPLDMDEPAPVGKETAPNASRVLAAAIGNCLSSSLLFCARKGRIDVGPIRTRVTVRTSRNERGRLRIAGVHVEIDPKVPKPQRQKALRCLDLFEDFCVVTQSVRQGFPVEVSVKGLDELRVSAKVDDPGRHGAKQPGRFDPQRADKLDDPSRFEYLPPERIVELLEIPSGATVVDFGTGTGAYAIRLAAARPDVSVVALDEQPEMLARLRAKPEAKSLDNLHPALPDQLPALRGRARRVLAINVLHELGDDSLRELAALLGAGGFALFADWNADVDRPVGPPRDHVYGPREAAARLERFGFSVETLESFPYHYVLRARLSSQR